VVARPISLKLFPSRMSRKIGISFLVETQIDKITPLSSSTPEISVESGFWTKTGSDGKILSSCQIFAV